jgi:hypothetical protein
MIRGTEGYDLQEKRSRRCFSSEENEERGKAFQTQRSVVEGEEQEELMWTKEVQREG